MTLPVLLIGLLLVVQVGVVVRDVLALDLAAREGAREASVSSDDSRVREAVRRTAAALDAGAITVDVSPAAAERRRGEPIRVSLSYPERIRIPVVGRFVDDELVLRSSASMRLERVPPSPTPVPP